MIETLEQNLDNVNENWIKMLPNSTEIISKYDKTWS